MIRATWDRLSSPPPSRTDNAILPQGSAESYKKGASLSQGFSLALPPAAWLASNGRGAPARLLEGKMSHAIGRNEWLKRAGTTSIPLPEFSPKLGGGAPARLGKKLCRYPWRAGRASPAYPSGASLKRCSTPRSGGT